ncbi:MAG TPA: hypothetical protein VGK73_32300 [Polyangiaceae bacterium]
MAGTAGTRGGDAVTRRAVVLVRALVEAWREVKMRARPMVRPSRADVLAARAARLADIRQRCARGEW